ncbi:PLP-dependent aminotransferase family protein [Cellulosimicrobium sp. Marseille-Q4280]|uniref:MocR-like pyridoxine biosynthesis transcription factor PdxR n=1 Tax=Cellulosimicrobium sp. Marseille-Q4280 TaxID=2937992 RepID=UPI00203D1311|nr:PLP-dependent aminotransferase family protein [Cellulosimicrobium sp. Marseille-Q4280]
MTDLAQHRLEPDALLLLLGPRPDGAVGRWIEDGLRTAIVDGRLSAGAVLPSSRDTATALGVARGTVTTALDLLVGDGLLVSRPRAGVAVAALRGPSAASASMASDPVPAPRPARAPSVGTPDPALFPRTAWSRAVRSATAGLPDSDLGYPDPQGLPALREALADHLRQARGAQARARDVVVVSGVAQGLTLLAGLLAARGAGTSAPPRVAVEDPSSPGAVDLLLAAGLGVDPVPVDDDGLRTDLLPDASAVLVTPAHQFPLGVVLAPDRRREVLAWAGAGDRYVLEDDYDAELRYDRRPVAALQAMDPDRVVLLGSVSKMLSPALRLGWVLAPPQLVGPLVEAKTRADLGCSVPEQAALADLLRGGAYGRHLRRVRTIYRRRRAVLLDALAAQAPGLRVRGVDAGLHVVVELGSRGAEEEAVRVLAGAGVPALALSATGARPGERFGVVVGTARVRDGQVGAVVRAVRAK